MERRKTKSLGRETGRQVFLRVRFNSPMENSLQLASSHLETWWSGVGAPCEPGQVGRTEPPVRRSGGFITGRWQQQQLNYRPQHPSTVCYGDSV